MSLSAHTSEPFGGQPADEDRSRKAHVIQGEFLVSDEPDLVMTTILGSCVAACLCDARARVGGMNHFLLPGGEDDRQAQGGLRFGVQSMELLVNGLLRRGARRENLEAKLFGGARMIAGLTDIGDQNATFAEKFLRDEGIRCTGGSLRGDQARRIQFWPVTGRARQICLDRSDGAVFAVERQRRPVPRDDGGALELF